MGHFPSWKQVLEQVLEQTKNWNLALLSEAFVKNKKIPEILYLSVFPAPLPRVDATGFEPAVSASLRSVRNARHWRAAPSASRTIVYLKSKMDSLIF